MAAPGVVQGEGSKDDTGEHRAGVLNGGERKGKPCSGYKGGHWALTQVLRTGHAGGSGGEMLRGV